MFTFAVFHMPIYIYMTSMCMEFSSGFSASKHHSSTGENRDKTILMFGGNGFIGSATTERLLEKGYSLILLNRGNWYWDTADTIKSNVTHWKCDRMESLQRCGGLQRYIWQVEKQPLFEAVVDFSAYHAFEITEALNMLNGKVNRYIYISSDSVYEVCQNKSHEGFTREEDALRPDDEEEREVFRRKDDYGNRKLECEEELERLTNREGGIPYVTLRLPDVIGPCDNTYRWWIYQLWVKLAEFIERPLSVPRALWDEPISFVYSNDVANLIVDIITSGPEINNQAFNLALDETPTLRQYLHSVMDELNTDDFDIVMDNSTEPFRLFPSVRSGPVDATKAKKLLNWNPTSWIDVLSSTVAFYEAAIHDKRFESARNDVIRTLQQYLTRNLSSIVRGLRNKYGLILPNEHEEL